MKVEYRYTKDNKDFLNTMKKTDMFEKSSYEIQKLWIKIHACEKELIKLYCEQSDIKSKDDCNWGICINNMSYIPEKLFECGTGMVRKSRNNVKNSDGTCKTCPYFMKEEDIDNWYRQPKCEKKIQINK